LAEEKARIEKLKNWDPGAGFDYRAEIKDPKTGKLVQHQHYTWTRSEKGEYLKRISGPDAGKYFAVNGAEIEDPKKIAPASVPAPQPEPLPAAATLEPFVEVKKPTVSKKVS
jgi:hypothetical protein